MWEIDFDECGRQKMFLVEEQTFATPDTTVRKVVIKNPFLLSDTVGFIRKFNATVDSFKSTLDEVREADLLHVVDISHPEFEDHHSSQKIKPIDKANDKPVIMVLIKSMRTNI
jgi:GTP-binding protein HflX